MKKVTSAWDQFWFSPLPLVNVAVFRVILCGTMFLMALSRQFDLMKFYSDDGILPRRWAFNVMPEFFHPPFGWFFWPDSMTFAVHGAMVLGLLALTFGIGGRALALATWILHIGFLQRNYSIAFGADLITGVFLFQMSGMLSCERLSIWKWWRGKPAPAGASAGGLHAACYRMIQVQLCVIYAYTGWEKLRGGTWWDGTALWTVLANPQMVVVDLTWLRYFPWLIVFLNFSTMLFEMYFPVLVWNKKTRPGVLAAGLLFHMGIGVVMALMNFATAMLAPYVLFLNPSTVERALVRLSMRQR